MLLDNSYFYLIFLLLLTLHLNSPVFLLRIVGIICYKRISLYLDRFLSGSLLQWFISSVLRRDDLIKAVRHRNATLDILWALQLNYLDAGWWSDGGAYFRLLWLERNYSRSCFLLGYVCHNILRYILYWFIKRVIGHKTYFNYFCRLNLLHITWYIF